MTRRRWIADQWTEDAATLSGAQAEHLARVLRAEPGMQAGRYVAIAVSDTGVGISEDMLEKVFEPFYTTKPIGQGTGLGLSMIYGFARQSGGEVRIHSQPGRGTTVTIHLPANDVTDLEQLPAAGAVREGKGQSVLLIEDDPSVRMMVRELLNELQYEVHEAPNADVALPILTLFADVVGIIGLLMTALVFAPRRRRVVARDADVVEERRVYDDREPL